MDWIWTYTGRRLEFDKPEPYIADIAHHLSIINRWTGATREPYSVAQHSVLVSKQLPERLALFGLLHDAAEYAFNDLNKPAKNHAARAYSDMLDRLQEAIYMKYCGGSPSEAEHAAIKAADLTVAATEARDFMKRYSDVDYFQGNRPLEYSIEVWPWRDAKTQFLNRFLELM